MKYIVYENLYHTITSHYTVSIANRHDAMEQAINICMLCT